MPEGVQKATQNLEKALQKRIRNYMAKSCLEKPESVAKRLRGGTPEAPTNRPKTDPETPPSRRGPTIWSKVARSSHFTSQNSHFIDFGYHFASFLKGICDPKSS